MTGTMSSFLLSLGLAFPISAAACVWLTWRRSASRRMALVPAKVPTRYRRPPSGTTGTARQTGC